MERVFDSPSNASGASLVFGAGFFGEVRAGFVAGLLAGAGSGSDSALGGRVGVAAVPQPIANAQSSAKRIARMSHLIAGEGKKVRSARTKLRWHSLHDRFARQPAGSVTSPSPTP